MGTTKGNWQRLGTELTTRFKKPFGEPVFIGYFFVLIVIVGLMGIWLPWIKSEPLTNNNFVQGFCTYYLALGTGASSDLLLGQRSKLKSLNGLALGLLVIGLVTAIIVLSRPTEGWAVALSIAATILALSWWWVANADNEQLMEDVNSIDALGGNTQVQPQGNLQGLNAGNG